MQLGAYQILAELGSGGMGKVYRATATQSVAGLDPGCSVALKVIHTHLLETPGFFQRFLREADVGRAVQHENVVRTILADAILQDGVQKNFLVMEYVEGQTLRDLLEELERVPEELCRHIGREVAKGLAAIHAAGVVHRDIKPENVLITPDHVVKVMDLGVARLQDEAIRLSQAGDFVGSLEYAAPEQFRARDGEPDGRADLHALGLLLYELSTGLHPYRDADVAKLLHRILDDEPRKAGEVNPQLSPFFEEVVHTLLRKDREERFADAATLAGVLEEGEESAWWKEHARALRLETKRPLRRIRIPRETALYGRDDDLSNLHGLYERAKAGDGQVVLIEGEAGIGKTRLVDEFVGRLRQEGEDLNFLFGSYPPGGAATAAGAFSTAYREHLGAEGLEGSVGEYLKPTPILIPAFVALLRGESTPAGAEALTKDSLQTVFVHATRSLASERVTIVLIDDLHFSPEDGRALFSSLAMAVPGHRILLIGTMRPGVPEDWTANITRLEHAEHVSLVRLGPKDLSQLLKDAFRSERLARELALQISEKSDGNPFFAFEIIRGLREGRLITEQPDGVWVTTRVIQDIQVPSSVMDLVNARIAGLAPEERDLLDIASCCGFEFDPLLLAEVVGSNRITVLKQLAQIERARRLVRSSGRRFAFDHHQVQESIYQGLPDLLREEYHGAVAEALERSHVPHQVAPEELDGALCVDLCEHFLRAGRGEQALRYVDPALDHLASSYLGGQAVHLMTAALRVEGLVGGERRVQLLLRQDATLRDLARPAERESVLAEARALAGAAGSEELISRVDLALAWLMHQTGRSAQAREIYERQRVVARRVGNRTFEARAEHGLSIVATQQGRLREAREHAEISLALAGELQDPALELTATSILGLVDQREGRYAEARAHFDRQRSTARQQKDWRRELRALHNLALVAASEGAFDEARELAERVLVLAHKHGDRLAAHLGLGNLGVLYAQQGDHERARACYEEHLALATELGDEDAQAAAHINLGLLAFAQGRLAEAVEELEGGRRAARACGNRLWEANAVLNLAFVAVNRGLLAEAVEQLRTDLALREELRDPSGKTFTILASGIVELELGRFGRAKALLEEGLQLAQEISTPRVTTECLRNLAALARECGEPGEAEALLTESLAVGRRHGLRVEEANALVDLGWLLARTERTEEASERLEEALKLARETSTAPTVVTATLFRGLLPGGDLDEARRVFDEDGGTLGSSARLEALLLLHQATGETLYLVAAKETLDHRLAHAPDDARKGMLDNVRLNREVLAAWTAHGQPQAPKDGGESRGGE